LNFSPFQFFANKTREARFFSLNFAVFLNLDCSVAQSDTVIARLILGLKNVAIARKGEL
jgi:hypothetical protein